MSGHCFIKMKFKDRKINYNTNSSISFLKKRCKDIETHIIPMLPICSHCSIGGDQFCEVLIVDDPITCK